MNSKNDNITLLDILDGVLDKGVVITGDLILSIADIDLVYVNICLLVTAVENIHKRGNRNDSESWNS
ncbi:gas vesicle protein [Bacillus sp. AFS077874]|uniref:gas vesicle protein n=1 Tax=unclassified Bacillus (in: firmicutes) TaxID=185979 RepID=UPI000BED4784|nr:MULTISPECIES: gas vesicle protein [unclassified Bacillus (in: firmicutes)]PEC50067.1 gas vesicle protein [Bacillus sp. AFS096315]PFM79260.1 gas vesicle protein [Bacillus sp. AFS077874]